MPESRDDSYGYGPDEREWFERFDFRPADPDEIAARLADGESLQSLDVPSHLDRKLVPSAETGTSLYRLVQLFGLPNVPGLRAGGGALGRERYRTTWQYLFEVSYEPTADDGPDVPTSFLLSVYDYGTDVSCGLSAWSDDGAGTVEEPVADAADAPAVRPPGEEFLVGVAQLVLNVIEEPVPATYEGLWI